MSTIIERLGTFKPEQVRTFTLAVLVMMAGAFYWHFTTRLVPARDEAANANLDFEDDNQACTDLRRRLRSLMDEQVKVKRKIKRLDADMVTVRRDYGQMAAHMVRPGQVVRVEQGIAELAVQAGVRLLSLEKKTMEMESVAGVLPPFVRRRYAIECFAKFPAAMAFVSLLEKANWPVRIARVLIREAKGTEIGVLASVELDLITPEPAFRGRPPELAAVTGLKPVKIRDLFFRRPRVKKAEKKKSRHVDFGQLALTGIVGSGTDRAAVMNGRIVRKGSIVNGASVVRVDETRVVLSKQGAHKVVELRSMADTLSSVKSDRKKE